MIHRNIHAYTEPGKSYPDYISVNERDVAPAFDGAPTSEYSITIRVNGLDLVLALTHVQMRALARDLINEFGRDA